MKTLYFLLVSIVIVFNNFINGQIKPSVAFHKNLPAMYKTDRGWVVSDLVINKVGNHTDIVKFCKDTYPNYTIINAAPIFKKEVITNWCDPKRSCTANDKFEIHPIECINTTRSYRPIFIPSTCKLNIDQGRGCQPFHTWKQVARTNCDGSDQTLRDLQVIFPCKDMYMMFSEVEYICCSDGDEFTLYSPNLSTKLNDIYKHYKRTFDDYSRNSSLHSEHSHFSKTKHALEESYVDSLKCLNEETVENFITVIRKNDDMSSHKFKKSEEEMEKTYTHNFESITHKFKRHLFDLDNIHIRRMVKRSNAWCRFMNNTEQDLVNCLKELDSISRKINAHFRKMLHLQGVDQKEYLTFMESRLKHLYSKYLPLVNGNKMWSDKFNNQLRKYSQKLKLSPILTRTSIIKQNFKHCKEKAALFIHNQEHYLSLTPLVAIIAAVILVFVCVVSTLAYKFGGSVFRRGSHNYMMRVVGDPVPASNSINRPEVKLNLYENPIFNSKPSMKPIEKQALIENMEN